MTSTLSRGPLEILPVGASVYFSWAGNSREVRFSGHGYRTDYFVECCEKRQEIRYGRRACTSCAADLTAFGLYGELKTESDFPASWADWLFGDDLDVLLHGLVVPQMEEEVLYLPEPWGPGPERGAYSPDGPREFDASRVAPDLTTWLARLDSLDLV